MRAWSATPPPPPPRWSPPAPGRRPAARPPRRGGSVLRPRRGDRADVRRADAAFLVAQRFPEARVIGVDLSPAMIAATQAKTPPQLVGRVRFLSADAAELPI